jgi:signal transduction histidine kinase
LARANDVLKQQILERQQAEAAQAMLEAELRQAQKAERERLAAELHDSVSQALFSMTLHTRALQLLVQQQGADPDGKVARGLSDLQDLTKVALAEMRELLFQMRPETLDDEGLVQVIRRHAASVAGRTGIEVTVDAPEDRLPLPEDVEYELLRMVQEALHNGVKHANPGRVDIRLVEPADAPGTLVVEVADDGTGFSPDVVLPGHMGLESMRQRVQRVGGRLTIDSSPAGSTVRAVLPDALRKA